MNALLQESKRMIRPYLTSIPDHALWQLCAMAKDGAVIFTETCRCIRGIVGGGTSAGYHRESSFLAIRAELGLLNLGPLPAIGTNGTINDRFRNLRLLPMVRAEIRRRSRLAVASESEVLELEEERNG